MTLSTDVYILDEVDPEEVFRFCQGLLTKYDDPYYRPPDGQRFETRQEPNGSWTRFNQPGQNLPAWLFTYYRDGGPLLTPEVAVQHNPDYCDDEDEPCDGKFHPRACWMRIDFDTSYGYRDKRGWDAGMLHAAFIFDLADWFASKDLRWEWENEYTGDVYSGTEGLETLIQGTEEATTWFRNVVLPAIPEIMKKRKDDT